MVAKIIDAPLLNPGGRGTVKEKTRSRHLNNLISNQVNSVVHGSVIKFKPKIKELGNNKITKFFSIN